MRPSLDRGPLSLLARTNLTLAFSSVLIVAISTAALNVFVVNPIEQQSADDQAALLVLTAQTWVELPPEARWYFELELAENHDLIVFGDPRPLEAITEKSRFLELLESELAQRAGQPVLMLEGDELVWANVPMGGAEIQIGFSPTTQDIQPLYVGVIIVGLGAGIVFFTSLFIVRRVARPLMIAAERAESFRGAEDFDPLPEEGPEELVVLAQNFNTMAREIAELLSNRTTLLAGISHDLRTPLTRMRLALELLPENTDPALVERLERNLEAMDELIGDALRFARGAAEPPQPVAMRSFMEELAENFDVPLECTMDDDAPVEIAPGAFSRVVMNLVSNALQHGTEVRLRLEPRVVHVLDSGPGIPVEFRERVFQPFFRLDSSRSSTTGGSGLGLAIVQQLCQAHGWEVAIGDQAGGGTDVRVAF